MLCIVSVACEGDTIYYINNTGTSPDSSVSPDTGQPDGGTPDATPDAIDTSDIVIGLVWPQTDFTGPAPRAAQLAIDEVNASGGLLNDRTVTLLFQLEDQDQGLDSFRAAIEGGAVSVVGPANFNNAQDAIEIAATERIPFFSLFGGAAYNWGFAQEESGPWGRSAFVAPSVLTDDAIGELAAGQLGCTTIGASVVEDLSAESSQALLDEVKATLESKGLTWGGGFVAPQMPSSLESELAVFDGNVPDCFMVDAPHMAYVARDAPAGFDSTKLILANSIRPDLVQGVADSLAMFDGAYGFAQRRLYPDELNLYLADYEAVFGEQLPDGQHLSMASIYDFVALTLLAIEAAGSTDGAAIRTAIAEVGSAGEVEVRPSNLTAGLEALRQGKTINYEGSIGPADFSGGAWADVGEPRCYTVVNADALEFGTCD